ncbi:MAG: TonB-dependent receptor [bacterium]|nr:TonB-dependent receptor [bacterium]
MLRLSLILFISSLLFLSLSSLYAQVQEDTESAFFLLEETILDVTTSSKFKEKVNETPSTMVIITGEEIDRRGYAGITELLQDLPGFDTIIPNGSSYSYHYTRGNRTELGNRTLFLLNGVNMQNLGFQNMNLYRNIPLSSIKKVEILYGPSSAIYGPDAFTGIINIITYTPFDMEEYSQKISAEAGAGSYKTYYGEFSYTGRLENLGIFITGRYFQSDEPDYSDKPGFLSNEVIQRAWRPMADRFNKYEDPSNLYAFFSAIYFYGLEIGYNRLYNASGSGPEYPLDKTLPSPQWIQYTNLVYARYSTDVFNKLTLTTLLSYKNGDTPPSSAWPERYEYDEPANGTMDVSMGYWQFFNEQFACSQDFVFKLSGETFISGGLSFSYNNFQKGYQVNWGDWVEDYETSYTNYPDYPSNDVSDANRYNVYLAGGYVQLKQHFFNSKLIIVPGVRYDYNSVYENTVNPRIGAVYKIIDELIFKANFGTGFQYPSPRNLYGEWQGTTVSENLEPEKIRAVETGFLFIIAGFLSTEVSGFYNDIVNTNFQGTNLPERRNIGVEYKLDCHVGEVTSFIGNLHIYFNYSFIDPRYKETVSNSTTGRSSDRVGDIASHKFNLGIRAEFFDMVRLGIRNNFVGPRETVVSNPIKEIDPFLISNIYVQAYIKQVTVSLLINNLFNLDYYHPGVVSADAGEDVYDGGGSIQESGGWYSSRLPQPGRNFMLSVKMRL